MKNKNTINKILSVFIALLMIFSVSTVSSIKSFADEVLAKKVHVIIENTTYKEEDGAAWEGTLVDDWITIKSKMTMMDAIVTAIEDNDLEQKGADSGYISEINGLSEKQGGDLSGWMGTKNDWMVNQGFNKFEVEENDEIRVMYTKDGGIDLGADYTNKTTSLKNISFSSGTLSTDFSSDTKEYTLELVDIEKIKVNPTASNKNYQVRIYKGENPDVSTNGYKQTDEIKVLDGDIITVICGDKSWEGSDSSLESNVYTFKIKSNIKPNTAPTLNKESDSQTINLGETYSVDLSTIFTDAENDELSYTVSIDKKEEESVSANYSFKPEKTGNYELEFRANDGKETSDPYTVKLAVDDGQTYKVNLQDTKNGSIDVDIKEGKLNTTVTLTVKPDDGFAMDTLEIKDKDGNDIKRAIDYEKSDGINYVYTFDITTSDITINATFGKAYTYMIAASAWFCMYDLEVYNQYGEVIPPKTVVSSDNWKKKSYYHLVAGNYKYKGYGVNGNIGKEGTLTVEKNEKADLEKDIQAKYFIYTMILIHSDDVNKEKDSDEVNIKITNPDGSIMNEEPGYIQVNSENMRFYCYLLEAKGVGNQYKIEVTPKDENVLYSVWAQGADKYDKNATYISAGKDNFSSSRDIHIYLESKAEDPVEYRVNKNANLHIYYTYGNAYVERQEVKPISVDTSNKEYDSYKFELSSAYYMVCAGGEGTEYVKTCRQYCYVDPSKIDKPIDFTCLVKKKDYVKNPYDYPMWDDIYTNIKDEGSYVNMDVGDTKRLETFRVWQGTTSPVSNQIFEPDKDYEVIYGSDCISLTEKGGEGRKYVEMKAKKSGVAIIKITYDAMIETKSNKAYFDNYEKTEYGFNAIGKEHTGIVIVNIGGSRGDIEPNIKVRDRNWTKYDTFYFVGDTTYPDGSVVKGKGYGEYTFTPSEGVSVETHDPIHLDEDFANNWTKYEKNKDSSYTIKLKTGRNIIRMTKGDDVVYFVMNAMESDITISNKTNEGQNLKVGDEASVSFTNFECPIYKMTAIYNPGYPNNTYMVYDLNGESVIGVRSQYAVESPITFKIEKNGTYKLSNGLINANHLGSALDTHCNIPEDGLPPNLSAVGGGNDPHFCILPDVEIKVQSSTQDENTISFDADNGDDIITKSVKSGEALDYEPKSPTKSGYTFVGWYKDTDDIKTSYKNNQIYTENTTYKAKWAHVEMLGAQGKSVVNDKSGIRFGTKIYNDGDEIVEKGTLIIPANLLKDGESLTLDTANIAKSVAKYIYEVNKDENYDIYLGTIVNIPREQFDRKMTASSYVIYKDKSGNKYTVYSPYKNTSISVNDLIK